MDDRLRQTATLRDGRTLGYAEFGDPRGRPILYFHGFPTSRLDWPLNDPSDAASDLGVRIVAPDRPGIGLSDFKPGFRILDWPGDVSALADALGLDRFSVLGVSGGAPFALACAHAIPRRLDSITVVSGMGPPTAPGAKDGFAMVIPSKARWLRRLMFVLSGVGLRRDPARVLLSLDYPAPDRELLTRPEPQRVATQALLEADRAGTKGSARLAGLYARPWGFALEDIAMPVRLFHGEDDRNVPASVARHVARRIPDCRSSILRGEGHFTVAPGHIESILAVGEAR